MNSTAKPTDNTVVAAEWLASQIDPPRSPVPALKQRFGLSALQACQAIAAAQQIRQHARNAE